MATVVAKRDVASDAVVPGARRLALNYLLLTTGEFAAKGLTLAGFLYLGRVLGAEAYGQFELVLAAMVFFTLPVDFGLGAYGAREVARDRGRAQELLREIAALRLLLAGCSYAVLLTVVLLLPAVSEVRGLLALYGLSLFAAPALLQWFFQGHDRMPWVAAASVTRQSVFVGLVFLLMRPGTPLYCLALFECAAAAAAGGVCLFGAGRMTGSLPLPWGKPTALLGHFRSASAIGGSELAWALLWYSPTVLLGTFVGGEALGWFGAAHRVVMALHTFVWLYFFNLLPSLARCAGRPAEQLRGLLDRSLTLTAWAGVLVAVGLTTVGGDLLALAYGRDFAGAGPALAVLAWVLPVALVSGHYRYTLIAANLQHVEFACTAVSAAIAVASAVVLIPGFGAVGAAAALLAANVVNLALAYLAVWRRVAAVPFHTRVAPPLLAAAFAFAVFAGLSRVGAPAGAAAAAATALYFVMLVRVPGLTAKR